jgi:hypothetical protein
MSHSTGGASRDDEGATPTFTIMALLTGLGGSPMDRLFCSSEHGVPLGRNGYHVPAHERVPFAALAEPDLLAARPPVPAPSKVSPAVEDPEPSGGRNISAQSLCSKGER